MIKIITSSLGFLLLLASLLLAQQRTLLQKTQRHLHEVNKQPSDIIFIGASTSDPRFTWPQFAALANTECHCDGDLVLPEDFVIVFSDGSYMSRTFIDPDESWRYFVMSTN